MDNGQLLLLNWTEHGQGKSREGLRHSLLCVTLELENTRQAVQEELKKREEKLTHLKELLDKTISERNEAENKCRKLSLERFLLQQQAVAGPTIGISEIEDEPRRGIDLNNTSSLSDCEENTVSRPGIHTVHPQLAAAQTCATDSTLELVPTKPLPEKGKLLQAVLKAGPLLQTLLLVGPLPQWRHPPPSIKSTDIPPARIPSLPRALAQPTEFLLKDNY
ncbi:hypothetical protein MLD38_040178 [Melastoma candidum]|uniref:Uncharacterized protein n=1 Tax=Melastoma candidum TaxID=119954 RepID=A0ACB9L592_9MYRT|nr:hypothetical protein MLD38_040178 [Melastoma candidum]